MSVNPENNLLDIIATNINDIVWLLGADGHRKYVSPSVRKVLGYSPEELIGTFCYDYYHREDLPRLREELDRVKAGLESRNEFRHRRKDGSFCWLEGEASSIVDAAGCLAQVLVVSRDITARKKTEQALQASYEQLALAIDGAKAGIWGFEHSRECRFSYRQWWAVLGYGEGEVASTREGWLSLCHPEDRGLINQEIADYLAGRRAKFELEYRIRHRNGGYRWVLTNGKLVDAADGKPPYWAGLIVDTTERRKSEEAQRESERRLRDFARAIPDVSMIVDERGRYVEVFAQDDRLLPRPCAELKGRALHQGMPARDADFLLKKIRRTLKTRRPQVFGLEMPGRDSRRFTEVRMAPMNYLADGRRTVAVVFTDVSEKRRAEKLVEFTFALRRRSAFMDEVIQGKSLDARAVNEAKALGIDLAVPLFCCVVELAADGGSTAADVYTRQCRIIEMLGDERQFFVWDCRGNIGVIRWGDGGGGKAEDDLQVAGHILDIIAVYDPQLQVAVGVGNRLCGFEGIRKSYRQAASAALVASHGEAAGRVCHFRDIGIYKFLANFSGEEQAREYVRETLGKLMEYDRRKGTDLLHTLEEILQSTSLKAAAGKLFLHYNTAVLHKHRIESILGASLEDVEIRLTLAAAVKLRKLGL